MKKTIFIIILFMSCIIKVTASTKADTIAVNNNMIERVIVDETINTKGNKVKKYYFIYNGELINTSKTVIEKYNLCKKYNAKIALIIVKRGNNKRIIFN